VTNDTVENIKVSLKDGLLCVMMYMRTNIFLLFIFLDFIDDKEAYNTAVT